MFLRMGLATILRRELVTYTSMGDTGVNFRVELLGCLDLTGLDVCMDIIAINFDPFLSRNCLHSKIFYRRSCCRLYSRRPCRSPDRCLTCRCNWSIVCFRRLPLLLLEEMLAAFLDEGMVWSALGFLALDFLLICSTNPFSILGRNLFCTSICPWIRIAFHCSFWRSLWYRCFHFFRSLLKFLWLNCSLS